MIDREIDDAPDLADDDQREAWRIHSDREATWALRKMAVARAESERIAFAASDEIDALRAWHEAAAAGPDRDAAFFEAALIRYRLELEERDPDLPKTYKLPGGVITRRKRPNGYRITDLDAYIAWALENDPGLLQVGPRVSGLRDYGVATDDDHAGRVVNNHGQVVPGVEYVVGEDGYSAKPG